MTFKKKLTPPEPQTDEPIVATDPTEPVAPVEEPEQSEPAREYKAKKRTLTIDSELSDEAKAQVTKQALDKVEQELMKKKRDEYLASELDRLRLEAGISAPSKLGGTHDELVEIKLDLGYEGQACIQLNQPYGPCYYHGVRYTVPRHIAAVLNDAAWNGAKLTKHTKGESIYRNRIYGTELSGVKGRSDTGRILN